MSERLHLADGSAPACTNNLSEKEYEKLVSDWKSYIATGQPLMGTYSATWSDQDYTVTVNLAHIAYAMPALSPVMHTLEFNG